MTDTPVCPNCNYKFTYEQTFEDTDISLDDQESTRLVCLYCNKIFYTLCIHSINFLKIDENGDEI